MKWMIETAFNAIDPQGQVKRIDIRVSSPQRGTDDQWIMEVECPAIPYASGTFTRHDPLACVCFTLKLLHRFIAEELRKGYSIEHYVMTDMFVDDLFHMDRAE